MRKQEGRKRKERLLYNSFSQPMGTGDFQVPIEQPLDHPSLSPLYLFIDGG